MSRGLVVSCNKKSVLYKDYIKNRTVEKKCKYIRYRNKLKSILKFSKDKFYENKFNAVNGNIRKTWSILNNITNRYKSDSHSTDFTINGNRLSCPKEIVLQ